MLSTISRQTLRVSRSCRVQSFNSLRHYSSEGNNNKNDSNNNISGSDSGESDSTTILDIISGESSQTKSKSSTHDDSTKLILETLTRVSDRQQQFHQSTSPKYGSLGRSILMDAQTCTHNLHIHASMNNTILTLTDSRGDPIVQQSAGTAGFKKSARSGPEAGYQAMVKMVEKVEEKNIQIHTLHVLMKGFGPGRDSAFKAIRAKTTWDIKRITDTTPIPFNGCRPPKPRRL